MGSSHRRRFAKRSKASRCSGQGEARHSGVQDREPLAEVKRPAGGERRESRLSMGRRKSSSTCLATSMVSSRSNSPSWSRTGSGLSKRGMLEKLAGLMVPNHHRESSVCFPQILEFPKDGPSGILTGMPTRLGSQSLAPEKMVYCHSYLLLHVMISRSSFSLTCALL